MLSSLLMLFDALNATSLGALFLVLLAAIVGVAELGWWIGRRLHPRAADKDLSGMSAAALGLLALLIAFTYAMALNHYDSRQALVLTEANAIRALRDDVRPLPEADRAAILPVLRDYAALRTGLGIPYDPAKQHRDVMRSDEALERLWRIAAAWGPDASSAANRFVSALHDATATAESRITALREHVPVEILLMVLATALIAMGFTGYAAGVVGVRRQVPMLIMALLLAFLITVTQDLARPDRGFIDISNRPLRDVLAAIPAVGAASQAPAAGN